MTVCIAAIYEGVGILAASDRMLSAGDIEFEPNHSKIRFLTTSSAALIAGDVNVQDQIIQGVQADIAQRLEENPRVWLPIEDLAEFYRSRLFKAVNKMAESRVLAPFGLTMETFLARQTGFSEKFVHDLSLDLVNFQGPSVEAIILGIDNRGPHIYVVANESLRCQDSLGFAAIGGGSWHAQSQMMASKHVRKDALADTLWRVYSSKKRAEIAPGVGQDTDMLIISELGGLGSVADTVRIELGRIYEEERKRQARVAHRTRSRVGSFVQNILNAEGEPQDQSKLPENTAGDAPADVETKALGD